jgi:YVTN family beta-propeller protein
MRLPVLALAAALSLAPSFAAPPLLGKPDFPRWTQEARPADRFDAGTIWGRESSGRGLVPTNQVLTPAGRQVVFSQRANDCAVSPDGRWLAVKGHSRLLLLSMETGAVVRDAALPKAGNSYCGLLWSADGATLYTSGINGDVFIATVKPDGTITWADSIPFKPRRPAPNAIPVGMALSANGSRLYVALNGNNTVAEVDLTTHKVLREMDCEMLPYGVALVGRKLYVTNWGGFRPEPGQPTGPAGRWDSIVIDRRSNASLRGAVSVVDLEAGKTIRRIEVGKHPSAIVASPRGDRVYVANTSSDTVSVIDTQADRVVETIPVAPVAGMLFGSAPNALCLSSDGGTLYIANGTNNAVAVVRLCRAARDGGEDVRKREVSRVEGFVPVGWYPGGLSLTPDGKTLCVANLKGIGSRAIGRTGFNSHGHRGTVSLVTVPDSERLARYTRQVALNNRQAHVLAADLKPRMNREPVPVPERIGEPSVFKHVLYIIKENRTYDQVFGDIERAEGDPKLCLFGREVTPNQHKAVDEFCLMDNFHCSGVLSADGHHWATEAYVTDYLEKAFGGFVRSYPYEGDDAMAVAPSGYIWDNCLAHGKTVRCYGEMVQAHIEPKATWAELYKDYLEGTGKYKIYPTTKIDSLRPHLCPTSVGFPATVSDQYRAQQFLNELKQFEATGNMPSFMVMLLPNDHTSGTRPGIPTPRAQVADNDLAVGRILEALSRSRFWKDTVVFITEDDPQAGVDHVDGHRTVGLVASAYSRMGGRVVSTNYNQTSMIRTIEQILGLPPMNQIDASATPMTACFTDKPDFTPFVAVPNNIPLDEMNPTTASLSGEALHWAKVSEALPLDEVDECDEDTFNRLLWASIKGYGVPYPDAAKVPHPGW